MLIARKYNRTVHDDFVLHVKPYLDNMSEALPLYDNGVLTGWNIQTRYA